MRMVNSLEITEVVLVYLLLSTMIINKIQKFCMHLFLINRVVNYSIFHLHVLNLKNFKFKHFHILNSGLLITILNL